jgi:hypothetical protein
LLFDKAPFTGTRKHHLANVKNYHDSMEKLSLEDLEELLGRILSLSLNHQSGRVLSYSICSLVKEVMECDIPFDVDLILNLIEDGDLVDAHVDFGLCPWHTCSGKTDSGETSGVDTSLLGRFYHRLDHSILTCMYLCHNFLALNHEGYELEKRKALVFLDLQWYCRQCYPGVKARNDSKSFGCTDPSNDTNKLPAVGNPQKLEIVSAIQLALLKAAGLNVTSMRGMGDSVEESLSLTEFLDMKSPVNRATCLSDSIHMSVDAECSFYITQHPARMYRQFGKVSLVMFNSLVHRSVLVAQHSSADINLT